MELDLHDYFRVFKVFGKRTIRCNFVYGTSKLEFDLKFETKAVMARYSYLLLIYMGFIIVGAKLKVGDTVGDAVGGGVGGFVASSPFSPFITVK